MSLFKPFVLLLMITFLMFCSVGMGANNYNSLPSKLYNATIMPIETSTLTKTNANSTITLDTTNRSPLNGKSTITCVCPANEDSRFTITFESAQTFYPNWGAVVKTNKALGDIAFARPIIYLNSSWGTGYVTPSPPKVNLISNITNEWVLESHPFFSIGPSGNPTAWATTESNQTYTVSSINVRCLYPSEEVIFTLGGIWTLNEPKAKLIMTFDSPYDCIVDEVLPRLQAKNWHGVLAVFPYDGTTPASIGWDTEDARSKINTLYDAGWDMVSHSGRHESFSSNPEATWSTAANMIASYAEYKEWAMRNGWKRGIDFSCYPYTMALLNTDDGGDVLDPYLKMGRGQAARPIYGPTARYSRIYNHYNPAVPFDMLNLAHIDVATSSQTDYNVVGGVKDKLAEAVLGKGVLIIFGHKFTETPATAVENSIEWLDDFIADVESYVSAGTLEVVTMTDWYNELNGVEPYDTTSPGEAEECIAPPFMDSNGDCKVDLIDFCEFALEWMTCGLATQSNCWE